MVDGICADREVGDKKTPGLIVPNRENMYQEVSLNLEIIFSRNLKRRIQSNVTYW
jgi:hypothetical protein